MSDELALRKDMERAARAKALIEDELLIEAFAILEHNLTEAWKNAPSNASQARESAYWAVKAVRDVRASLHTILANGDLAKAELDRVLGR